jgi:DNA helicase-2/ATP-dependent DNA helicase PcrA
MDFEKSYKQLNVAQKQAVDTLDGPVLVVAGPGTGKTQLLALRAANILKNTDVLPQNILCLTYTEVGARNMRERLTRYIGQAAYDIRISTYHGFGSELIRQYREYFNEFGAERPVDKLGQDAILHEIFATLPTTNPLWREETYLKDSLQFISEAKRALLTPDDLRTIAAKNLAFIEEMSEKTATSLTNLVKMDKKAVPLFKELLLDIENYASSTTLPGGVTPLANLCASELAIALEIFEETGKTNSVTAFKNNWFIKNSNNEWVLAGRKETKKVIGGADIYEQYLQKLSQKKLFDYDDMILRAIHALQTHDDLRYTLHEQYQYIMLDEFQDTNLSQLKLIELLTNNPVNEGSANVLAVGDDDQAIFSFQGAELTNMLRFHDMYKNVTTITLTENWRSHADILHTAHGVAEQIEERLHEKLGSSSKLLTAQNSNLPAESTLERHEFKSDIAQFDWVAKQIKKLLDTGTKPSEIAVLAPRHKHIEPLIPYLNALNIPVRYDKRENVLEDIHVNHILRMASLVQALATNNQAAADSIWPSVLSADFWAIPTSTIWKLSWQADENRYSKENDASHWQALMMQDEALAPIALFFAKLAAIKDAETLETMLDFITGVAQLTLNEPDLKSYTSPYFNYYFGKEARTEDPVEFTNVLSNLTVLRQNLREYGLGEDKPLILDDLLKFVEEYQNAGEKLLNTSPYHSAGDAVQLMTAYGAKGLEFDAVFVLAAQDDVWGMKARGQSNNITLPANLKIIRRAGSNKDERKRLFYVAITRAKHTLYLTSYLQNYAGKATTRLEFLVETEEGETPKSAILPAGKQKVIPSDSEAPAIEALEYFWTTRHLQGVSQSSLEELTKPRLENFQLSATHLNTFTDLVFAGPDTFFLNTILKFPKAPTADGQYGNAIHETIEAMHDKLRAHGELPDLDEAIEIFSQRLRNKRLSNAEYERSLGRGTEALKTFLPAWWHNFQPSAEHERSFRQEGAFIGNAHLSGTMDQLLIDNDSKEIRVVDFKTGKSHNRWTRDVKMHKYRQQLLFYKLLIEASHSYRGYQVTEGKLVFVEPNDDGDIDELSLSYNAEELERIKTLIGAVWIRIQNLDFPDTSRFSADLKGILEFEDWLIENI